MADRTKVRRDKHESVIERPREAKMARAARPRQATPRYVRAEADGRERAKPRSATRTRPDARAQETASARRAVASRNRPTRPRRAAERLNEPQAKEDAQVEFDRTRDHIRQRAENVPLGVRRAANLGTSEVRSPDVSLEVAHGPEGEAHAGQDLREPRMIPSEQVMDPGARNPKRRAEKRTDDAAEGES